MDTNPKTAASAQSKMEKYQWKDAGTASTLRQLPVAKLLVDHSYQRAEVSLARVLRIAGGFDWSLFGAISVMERDGQFYVTDGQHRVEACRRRGDIKTVPCVVTVSDSVQREAGAFIGVNSDRGHVSAYDKFRADVCRGEETALAVKHMASRLGYDIKQDTGAHVIAWPALLVKTFKANPDVAERCLVFQRAAIGPLECLHNYVHKGLFWIATHQKTGNIFEHADKIYAAGGLAAMLHAIKVQAISTGNEGVSERVSALGILDIVNRNLKTKKVTL